jgi:hypothetical protein
MDSKKKLTKEDLATYHKIAERVETAFYNRYCGDRVTHYIHVTMFHHEELQQECQKDGRTLTWYEQQGWEAMNKADITFINRHTTKGAQVGRKPKDRGQKRKANTVEIEVEEEVIPSNWREECYGQISWERYQKMKKPPLESLLKDRGLPTSGKKAELISRLVVAEQREQNREFKKKERESDPIKYNRWWNASIIVSLFKKEARRLQATSRKEKKQ